MEEIRPDRLHSVTFAASNQCPTSAPTPIDVDIIGGVAAINMLKPTNKVKTFQEYADLVLIPYVKGQLQHVQRLDFILHMGKLCNKQLESNDSECQIAYLTVDILLH